MTCSTCGAELIPGAPSCGVCGAPTVAPSTRISQRRLSSEQPVVTVGVEDVLSGRYRLEEKIGEGGMGTVYVAQDLELQRKVAVKLLAVSLVHDPEVQERFEREARLLAKLDHPNIVPIYDVGRHQGRPFIVMKLLQGDSLAGRLRAKGGFTTDETMRLMRQLAAGLDYIHDQGFIHRDIKAQNIFVSPEGQATILDFGILRPKSAATGITRTGMVMGTPHYMAPEQALGLKDVDHRVDLYAMAVVLFECLTGTLPFEADSELRLIQLQAHAPVPELLDRAPWVPKPVADVVKRALAKKPDERFPRAADLVTALELAYQEHKSSKPSLPVVPAPPPAVPPSTSPSARRLSRISNAALPVVTLEPAPPPPRRTALIVGAAGALLVGGVGAWWALAPPPPLAPVTRDAGSASPPPDASALSLALSTEDAGDILLAEVDAGAPWLELDAGLTDAGLSDAGLSDAGLSDAGAPEAVDAGVGDRRLLPRRKGTLKVIVTFKGEPYWAQLMVDGATRGRTPQMLELPAGRHSVRIERPGFRPQQHEVRVVGGQSVTLKLELVP